MHYINHFGLFPLGKFSLRNLDHAWVPACGNGDVKRKGECSDKMRQAPLQYELNLVHDIIILTALFISGARTRIVIHKASVYIHVPGKGGLL